MLSRLRSGRRPADGFTLIELLVVMVLLGITGSVVVAGVVAGSRSTRFNSARTAAVEDLQLTLERSSKDLRVADPLRAGTATSVTADVYRGGKCLRTTYQLNGTDFQVQRKTYDPDDCKVYPATASPVSTSAWKTIVSNVSSTAVFSYYDDQAGIVPTGVSSASPAPASAALALPVALPSSVTRLVIGLTADVSGHQPVALTTGVELRNHV